MAEACPERSSRCDRERGRHNCPIKKDAEKALKLGSEMVKSMRRVGRNLRYCPKCPDYDGCPVLVEFNAMVEQVLLELYEEWDLK